MGRGNDLLPYPMGMKILRTFQPKKQLLTSSMRHPN